MAAVFDLSASYRLSERITFYGRVDNLTSEEAIVGRQPYGARPNRDQSFGVGVRLTL